MEAKGIKETLEVLEGLKVLAIDVKKVLADGKVNISDLPVLVDLLGQFGTLSAAVEGADQVLAEVKDLSADEINHVVGKVLELVALIKAA